MAPSKWQLTSVPAFRRVYLDIERNARVIISLMLIFANKRDVRRTVFSFVSVKLGETTTGVKLRFETRSTAQAAEIKAGCRSDRPTDALENAISEGDDRVSNIETWTTIGKRQAFM